MSDVTADPELTEDRREEFMSLAREFPELSSQVPGRTNLAKHHIKLTYDEPVRYKTCPVPYSLGESLKQDIDNMIKTGVIRESKPPKNPTTLAPIT